MSSDARIECCQKAKASESCIDTFTHAPWRWTPAALPSRSDRDSSSPIHVRTFIATSSGWIFYRQRARIACGGSGAGRGGAGRRVARGPNGEPRGNGVGNVRGGGGLKRGDGGIAARTVTHAHVLHTKPALPTSSFSLISLLLRAHWFNIVHFNFDLL